VIRVRGELEIFGVHVETTCRDMDCYTFLSELLASQKEAWLRMVPLGADVGSGDRRS